MGLLQYRRSKWRRKRFQMTDQSTRDSDQHECSCNILCLLQHFTFLIANYQHKICFTWI
jgi:hypothetical protein